MNANHRENEKVEPVFRIPALTKNRIHTRKVAMT